MHKPLKYFLLICIMFLSLVASASELTKPFIDLKGKTLRLADYRGKWVVVNYWATWCPPCKQEIPELIMFHEKHKAKNAVVVGIDMEEPDPKRLLQFVDDNMISYPVTIYGKNTPVLGAVPGLPTTFIIDPQGEVVARQVGMIDGEILEDFIARHTNKLKK